MDRCYDEKRPVAKRAVFLPYLLPIKEWSEAMAEKGWAKRERERGEGGGGRRGKFGMESATKWLFRVHGSLIRLRDSERDWEWSTPLLSTATFELVPTRLTLNYRNHVWNVWFRNQSNRSHNFLVIMCEGGIIIEWVIVNWRPRRVLDRTPAESSA